MLSKCLKPGGEVTEILNIFFWNNQAYFPVMGKTEVGFFWDTDRILIADLSLEAMSLVMEEIIKIGNPQIHHPSQDEFRKKTSIQKALKMSSFKKMAQAGVICCVVYWSKDSIDVAFSPSNAKDIQEIDYANQKQFFIGTSIRTIVEYILDIVTNRMQNSPKPG